MHQIMVDGTFLHTVGDSWYVFESVNQNLAIKKEKVVSADLNPGLHKQRNLLSIILRCIFIFFKSSQCGGSGV